MADSSPFNLNNASIYQDWRQQKLENYPVSTDKLMVDVKAASDQPATSRLFDLCAKANLAFYNLGSDADREEVVNFGRSLGLHRLESHRSEDADGLVSIEVSDQSDKTGFIPYTNKRLNWHTDGYYNKASQRIKAFLMHCVQPADEGGENAFLDHEIAYIRLRDENPDFIQAFSYRRAMTIPSFTDSDGSCRPDCTGAVFGSDRYTGALHTRFTARKHNIEWKNDQNTKDALAFLLDVLENDPLRYNIKLEAGQGVVSNNVIHARTSFTDSSNKRLMLRGRYLDRVGEDCPTATQLAHRQYDSGEWN